MRVIKYARYPRLLDTFTLQTRLIWLRQRTEDGCERLLDATTSRQRGYARNQIAQNHALVCQLYAELQRRSWGGERECVG